MITSPTPFGIEIPKPSPTRATKLLLRIGSGWTGTTNPVCVSLANLQILRSAKLSIHSTMYNWRKTSHPEAIPLIYERKRKLRWNNLQQLIRVSLSITNPRVQLHVLGKAPPNTPSLRTTYSLPNQSHFLRLSGRRLRFRCHLSKSPFSFKRLPQLRVIRCPCQQVTLLARSPIIF